MDTFSYNSGRNTVRFGGEFQRIQSNEDDTMYGQGAYAFNNLTSFLMVPSRQASTEFWQGAALAAAGGRILAPHFSRTTCVCSLTLP